MIDAGTSTTELQMIDLEDNFCKKAVGFNKNKKMNKKLNDEGPSKEIKSVDSQGR